MARAASDASPVMDPKAVTKSTPKRTGTATTATAATAPSHLTGPYGASFAGVAPDGSPTRGLTFERRWTRPGVHPYDEITWEYRTAGIANETGKSVFEQKDVEVPDFWSQLATNVVVSKYFRGHLGTPERETSVRQLIDRVVNTITAWAETQRYFATDADLATFKAELTHLLVHQKMAFNSPVWFNVGIEQKPQCSACQPYHALVSTPDGMIPIGQLVEERAVGREVYDANGVTRIVAVKNNGQKPVRRIRLRNGNFVEATPDHVVKAVRQRRTAPEWLRVDELEVGMRMHEHAHGAVIRERVLALVGAGAPTPASDSQRIVASPPDALEIVAIDDLGTDEVYDIQTESGEYLSNNVAVHNCFINSVEDTMSSIMDLAKTEAMLFKFGSGAGSNLSTIRSSREKMAGGGTASGPVSFMKGYDAFAGVVKSGGKTRRAAKMVILDAGHPDILDFIDSKAHEEQKAWALIEAGYDPSFTGEAYGSVFFQNANHSVRVTDDFMRAVVDDQDWTTHAVVGGEPMDTYQAKDIFRRMAEAAHLCGDPGIQYDTTINDWNPVSNSARQYATNPCVTGDTLVATDEGWRSIESLVGERVNVIGADGQPHPVDRIFPTGTKPVFELRTRSGYRVRITADHKVATTRGDVAVKDLQPDDRIFLNAPGFGREQVAPALAEAIGLAVGDGCLVWTAAGELERPMIILTMHANEAGVLEAVAVELNDQKRSLKAVGSIGRNDDVHVSMGATGSRLAFASRPVVEQFMSYAVLDEGSTLKRFKPAVYGLDRTSVAALLRGLFTADGTVVDSGSRSQYVGLDSTSLELLEQVQRLLLGFGIKSKLYENRRGGKFETMLPDGRGGLKTYPVREMHSLRITRSSRVRFEREIGFVAGSPKMAKLARLNARVSTYSDELIDGVGSITPLGEERVFDLTEQATSHFVANGLVVHNCSEFSFLNDTSCNLASVNLMKFVRPDGEFDVDDYRYACRLTITAQEILVDNASYPTPRIEENSHRFRPLGLGYANLGALLMSRGLAYDGDSGRNFAAALTAIMTAEAYRQSAIIARDHGGPFAEYRKNEEPFLRVIGMHRDAAHQIPKDGVPTDVLEASRDLFDEALELGREHGYRNAQISLLAPTGTIAFMMDCDTTGVEPDIALIKYKKLVGEGFLKIVNQTVPSALRKLGYGAEEVDEILAYLTEHETIEGAPHLKPQHLPVFDCAFKPANGERSIHYMGHVRMMGAIQPFLSGAISKTVNMPEAATAEEIERVYLEGWKLGLKAIAVYRDNSKRSQPLSTGKKKDGDLVVSAADTEELEKLRKQLAKAQVEAGLPHRRRLPAERSALTHKFDIAGHEGYITVGLYPDGQPGEIFLKMAKEGSTVSGLMDTLATTISVALQYGVPLRDLVNKFAHVRFEPSGFTGNQEIPIAKSLVDYIFRWLGSRFLSPEDQQNLGLQPRVVAADAPPSAGPASQEATTFGAQPPADAGQPPSVLQSPQPETKTESDAPKATAVAAEPVKTQPDELKVIAAIGKASGQAIANGNGKATGNGNGGGSPSTITLNLGQTKVSFQTQADAPSCADCGSIMIRNGSCYKCLNCGSTSGCS